MSSNRSNLLFKKDDGVNDVWDDRDLIAMYNEAAAKVHTKVDKGLASVKKNASPSPGPPSNKNSTGTPKSWKVGSVCMAPYEEDGKYYSAKILKIFHREKSCEVAFTEYDGEKAIVDLVDLLGENDVTANLDGNKGTPEMSQEPQPNLANLLNGFPAVGICPPPPLALLSQIAPPTSDKEILTNMLMSWWMSGYHTGYYMGTQTNNK